MLLGGNRDNGSNAGSRCSNWNNSLTNSNWNIGCRFSCECFINMQLHVVKAHVVRLSFKAVSLFVQRKRTNLEVCKTTSSESETRIQHTKKGLLWVRNTKTYLIR